MRDGRMERLLMVVVVVGSMTKVDCRGVWALRMEPGEEHLLVALADGEEWMLRTKKTL